MTLTITLDKLVAISGRSKPTSVMRALVGPLQEHLSAAGILSSRLQTVHFLAQGCHETASFRTLVEDGRPSYFTKYDGRADLGNHQRGDGARFKGRGFLMTTGRANYAEAAAASGIDILSNPDMAAEPDTAVRIAVFYWTSRKVGAWAEADNARMVTKAINGGTNGMDDRLLALARAKEAYPRAPDWIDNPPIPNPRPA